MNSCLDKNNNPDFILACELFEKKFSHSDLIDMLKNGGIPEKQFSALKLDVLNNVEEGKILISNLTGCDGKIREAVALKINQLLTADNSIADLLIYPEIFASASIDINANICRLVIDSVSILKQNKKFSEIYLNKIVLLITEAFDEIDKFIFKDKKYVINKQLFKLYWCLDALKLFVNDIEENILLKILERASEEKEYTIREKIAQICTLTTSDAFAPLINKLKNDENYYVKAVFS